MRTVDDNPSDARFSELRHEVTEAGRTLWLAGLGAARRAEEEGRDLFETLVERGRKVEKKQFKAIDRTLAETGRRVRDLSDRVQVRFEDRVRDALNRLGMPTREDVQDLAGRLEALDRKVDKVAGERRTAAPAA
jgi:poly(hydroxyalkanoate) granule-associated protein